MVSVALADMQTSLSAGRLDLQWIVDGLHARVHRPDARRRHARRPARPEEGDARRESCSSARSLVAALARGTGRLIAGRVVMGVGAAGCEPGTLSMIRQIYPDQRERARALGVWTAVSGISLAPGPVLGGVLVAAGGWRGIFWFNVAFGLRCSAPPRAILRRAPTRRAGGSTSPASSPAAPRSRALTFAVIEGENVGYGTWWVPLLFVVAALAAAAFVVIERRAPDPVLRLEFFRKRTFSGATAVAFATSFGLFGVFFFTALYLQVVANYSGWRIARAVPRRCRSRWSSPASSPGAGRPRAGRAGRWPPAACSRAARSSRSTQCSTRTSRSGRSRPRSRASASASASRSSRSRPPCSRSSRAERSGHGRVDREHEPRARRRARGRDARRGRQRAARRRARPEADRRGRAGRVLRSLVVDAVTHGGLPANALAAAAANPIVRANIGLASQILDAAIDSFGNGLHTALVIAAVVMLVAAGAAALTGRD